MKPKIQSIVLLLMMAGITSALACKKNKDEAAVKTKTELLTAINGGIQ